MSQIRVCPPLNSERTKEQWESEVRTEPNPTNESRKSALKSEKCGDNVEGATGRILSSLNAQFTSTALKSLHSTHELRLKQQNSGRLAKFPDRSVGKTTTLSSAGKSRWLGKSARGMLTFLSEKVAVESGSWTSQGFCSSKATSFRLQHHESLKQHELVSPF